MGQPRFLFTSRVPAAEVSPAVAWRLVGGNNHELGRSFAAYADLDACLNAVEAIQQGVDRLEPEAASTEDAAQWGWRLLLDGTTVAMSGRWYRRVREAEYNLQQFLVAVPVAGVSTVVGETPPRRELLRPEFVLPHEPWVQDDVDDVVTELADQAVTEDQVAAS